MKNQHSDYSLIILIFILVVFGLTMLTSASSVAGFNKYHDTYYFLKHQLLYGLLPGLILFVILARMDFQIWRQKARLIFGAALILLAALFLPGLGSVYNGARSWLNLGPFSLQPAELAKLALLIYLSDRLSRENGGLKSFFGDLMPLVLMIGLMAGLVAIQPDLGTMIIIILIGLGLCFVAGMRWRHLVFLLVTGGLLFWVMIKKMPERLARLTVFLNPKFDPQGIGYHVTQALLAIGTGGFLGLGLGHSRQKFQYLPEVSGDSIFAVMAEELGFVLTTVFIALVIILVWKLLRLSKTSTNSFARLYLAGLAIWIGGQSLINIGAMLGIMPLTGVPLPFVSYGGTALMTILAASGMAVGMTRDVTSN
jgi:cell division protein FtsW